MLHKGILWGVPVVASNCFQVVGVLCQDHGLLLEIKIKVGFEGLQGPFPHTEPREWAHIHSPTSNTYGWL